jgi:glutamate-1-semialdehyde 2,1-aminomutase
MLEPLLRRNRLLGGTAAVIVEPMGPKAARARWRRTTTRAFARSADQYRALLIFDEVVTGFRVALGGAQGYFDVVPDLTIFAKSWRRLSRGGRRRRESVYAELMAAGLATGKHRAYVGGTLAANRFRRWPLHAIREIERTNACEIAGRQETS